MRKIVTRWGILSPPYHKHTLMLVIVDPGIYGLSLWVKVIAFTSTVASATSAMPGPTTGSRGSCCPLSVAASGPSLPLCHLTATRGPRCPKLPLQWQTPSLFWFSRRWPLARCVLGRGHGPTADVPAWMDGQEPLPLGCAYPAAILGLRSSDDGDHCWDLADEDRAVQLSKLSLNRHVGLYVQEGAAQLDP